LSYFGELITENCGNCDIAKSTAFDNYKQKHYPPLVDYKRPSLPVIVDFTRF
jgi:hypothetical protein